MGFSTEAEAAIASTSGLWISAALLLLSCFVLISMQHRTLGIEQRERQAWMTAGAAVVGLQAAVFAYALIALLASAPPVFASPLRWTGNLLSWIALLGIASLPVLERRARLALPIAAGMVILVGFGYTLIAWATWTAGCLPAGWAASACPPPGWLLVLTLAVSLAVSGAAAAVLVVRRPAGWPWLSVAAGVVGIAVFLDMVLARGAWPPGPFALLAALAFFSLLLQANLARPAAAPPLPTPFATTGSPAHTLKAAVDFAYLMQADSIGSLADEVVKATALATRVEFVLLLSPPDERGRFAAAKGYDHIRERAMSGFAMNGRTYPAIQEALVEHRSLEVIEAPKPPDLDGLMDEMEAYESGTLLLQPILSGDILRAGLLLFSPFAQRRWSAEEKAQLDRLCRLLADRFTHLQAGSAEDSLPARAPAPDRVGEGTAPAGAALGGRAWRNQAAAPDLPSDELVLVLQELAEARSQLALLGTTQQAYVSAQEQAATLQPLSARLEQGLRSASSYSGLLLDDVAGVLSSIQRKYLERMHAGLLRSQGLAQELRDRLAPGSEALEAQGESTDLDSCVQLVMSRYTVALREHDLRLQLDLPDRSPVLHAEPTVLEQMLDNLMANALAVTPDGEDIALTAHVILEAGTSYVLLDVTDHGPGIATEHLGLVFEPQVSDNARRPPGIQDGGVGLPLVKRLCEAVGGRVWVDSRPGYGTTYSALLPLASGETGTPTSPIASG